MKIGEDLDTLVAKRVLKWTETSQQYPWSEKFRGADGLPQNLLPFSTNISASWKIMEMLPAYGSLSLRLSDGGSVYITQEVVDLDGSQTIETVADTVSLAICLHALKVIGKG